jgi:hypothetical protein
MLILLRLRGDSQRELRSEWAIGVETSVNPGAGIGHISSASGNEIPGRRRERPCARVRSENGALARLRPS